MALGYFEIYADESQIDGGGPFFLGSLMGSPRRIEILRDRVRLFRKETGCASEMKWTKVSKAFLPQYKAFVDIALDDRFARIRVREVRRDESWRAWQRTEEERFWISYYAFLRSHMRSQSRYSVVLDYKPGKRHRWSKMRFAMNATAKVQFETKKAQVPSLKPRDSHDDDMLQLVDVLLGAMTSHAAAPHKVEMAEYVRSKGRVELASPWTVDLRKTNARGVRRPRRGRQLIRRRPLPAATVPPRQMTLAFLEEASKVG